MPLSSLLPILTSYRPSAAADAASSRRARRFGAFVPTYMPGNGVWRAPRDDREAQRLYNHIRTTAFWLDASPALADLGLPFRAGLDDLVGLIPLYGDLAAGVLGIYQVWLCFVFGVPTALVGWMLLNVLLDILIGLLPILGDLLDNLFKSNLRNLSLLEGWLLDSSTGAKYRILLMPDTTEYLPERRESRAQGGFASRSRRWWFGSSEQQQEEVDREIEYSTGRLRRTRRMTKFEGSAFGERVGERAQGGDGRDGTNGSGATTSDGPDFGTAAPGASASEARQRHSGAYRPRRDVHVDPID